MPVICDENMRRDRDTVRCVKRIKVEKEKERAVKVKEVKERSELMNSCLMKALWVKKEGRTSSSTVAFVLM